MNGKKRHKPLCPHHRAKQPHSHLLASLLDYSAGSHKLPHLHVFSIMAPIKHNAPLPLDIVTWYLVM